MFASPLTPRILNYQLHAKEHSCLGRTTFWIEMSSRRILETTRSSSSTEQTIHRTKTTAGHRMTTVTSYYAASLHRAVLHTPSMAQRSALAPSTPSVLRTSDHLAPSYHGGRFRCVMISIIYVYIECCHRQASLKTAPSRLDVVQSSAVLYELHVSVFGC